MCKNNYSVAGKFFETSGSFMLRRNGRIKRRGWIVFVLAAVIVAYFVLVSIEEKHGGLSELTGLNIPSADLIHALFEDSAHRYPSNTAIKTIENPGVTAHFIDVGQAKAIFVQAPEKTVLIDAGERDQGAMIVRYLVSHGIRTIDIVIGTHPHSDHIGGLETVIGGMDVGTVILPRVPESITPTTATYTALLEAIARAGLKITPAKPGDTYDLGGGAELVILGPINDHDELNDMSVVSKLLFGEVSFLFTGDATKRAEDDILDAGIDVSASVLDVGHHGSKTSTTERFLLAANPAVAVISCGIDNMYGHPHGDVVSLLRKYGQRIYRTDIDGTVIIATDGEDLGVKTEKGGGDSWEP